MIITRLDRGGSADVVLQLADRLQAWGHKVSLIYGETRDPQENLEAYAARTGVRLISLPVLGREVSPPRDFRALVQLARLIRKLSPDVLHTHTSKAGIVGRTAGFIVRTLSTSSRPAVLIHSPHGHIFYGYFSRGVTKAFIWLEKINAVWTDRVITLTKRGAADHVREKIAPSWKFVPIPCGIDLRRFSPPSSEERRDARLRWRLGGGRVIGWMGRLAPIKGCEFFLQACAQLASDYPDVRFLIAGDGEERPRLETLAKTLGLADRTTFLGMIDPPEVFYRAIDIYALTSINEGLGRVLVEAMACGVPVVATAVGGVPEVLENGRAGLLTPPQDPQAIAQAVSRLLDDDELARRLREAGLQRARNYDATVTARRTMDLYQYCWACKRK